MADRSSIEWTQATGNRLPAAIGFSAACANHHPTNRPTTQPPDRTNSSDPGHRQKSAGARFLSYPPATVDAMGTVVPLDRLGVPFHEFAAMIDEAVRQYHAAQDNRYLAAVLATLTWIAGMTDNDPLTRQHRPATLDAQSGVRVAATAIMHGVQDPIFGLTACTIHPEWATGVTRTLEWLLSPSQNTRRRQPSPLLGHN